METRTLQVNPEDTGTRLDAWLAGQLPDVTRSAAARLCEEGRVTAAGKPLAKNYRLGGGEAVSVTLPDPEPVDVAPQDIPLDVVYEDERRDRGEQAQGAGGPPGPRPPGRHAGQRPALPLRGLPLRHRRGAAARHRPPHRPGHLRAHHRGEKRLRPPEALAAQLQDHSLARIYRGGRRSGNLREDSGTVDAPIGRHPADRKKMAVAGRTAGAR